MDNRSEFTGSALRYLFYWLLGCLAFSFTFGLAFPWVYAAFHRWLAENTRIDGRQLVFDGTGSGLFWPYLLWLVLTFVTFGIYSFWLFKNLTAWRGAPHPFHHRAVPISAGVSGALIPPRQEDS